MNLAIIISVSDYTNENKLPGCKNDASLMKDILEYTGKYADILILDQSQESSLEKKELIEFIEKHQNTDIDELFFYFSGHGDFDGKEFYYLLADYDRAKPKQTSLENSELDEFLRSLNPKLAIKVVDACHSGVEYIKDSNILDVYIKDIGKKFSSCYFMYSSQSNQSSYADQNISYFTREFAQSLLARKSQDVRYKDITDYISDAFDSVSRQQPLFVSQAKNTEIFCIKVGDFDKRVKDLLISFGVSTGLITQGVAQGVAQNITSGSLVERIKADATKYCSESEAISHLQNAKKILFAKELSNTIDELFILEKIDQKDYKNIPNFSAIGNWVKDNKGDFFAEYTYRIEKVEYDTRNPFQQTAATLSKMLGTDTVVKVTGANSTVGLPFNQLIISVIPKFPNVEKKSLILVPFLSQTTLLIFYALVEYQPTGWNNTFSQISPKWYTRQILIKDNENINSFIDETIKSFEDFILSPLIEKFDTVDGEIVETGEKEIADEAKEREHQSRVYIWFSEMVFI